MDNFNNKSFHKEYYSRNSGLLTIDEQKKIANTSILIAGCGVGSQIALAAVRMGFEKFTLIDGDKVTISNNNRQGYSYRDNGRYKVDALGHKMKAINPFVKIKKYREFLGENNVKKLTKQCDIILDAIDPYSHQAILSLHREARRQHKHVIIPLDVGWGSKIYILNEDSISYEELLGLNSKSEEISDDDVMQSFIKFFLKISPKYVTEIVKDVLNNKLSQYPQPSPASYALASMCSVAFKKIALEEPVVLAPKSISFDAELELSI